MSKNNAWNWDRKYITKEVNKIMKDYKIVNLEDVELIATNGAIPDAIHWYKEEIGHFADRYSYEICNLNDTKNYTFYIDNMDKTYKKEMTLKEYLFLSIYNMYIVGQKIPSTFLLASTEF